MGLFNGASRYTGGGKRRWPLKVERLILTVVIPIDLIGMAFKSRSP